MFRTINRNLLLTFALIMATLVFAGCSDDDDNGILTPTPGSTFVRVGHLSPDAGMVDVWVDGAVAVEDVDFTVFSSYLELTAGEHRVQVSPANATSPIVID